MFNQQPKHGVIWSKLLGEWSRVLAAPRATEPLRQQWLRGAQLLRWLPPETRHGAANGRAGEALAAELASIVMGRWLHWMDAGAWLAKDTLNYVTQLQVEFAKASRELQLQSLESHLP